MRELERKIADPLPEIARREQGLAETRGRPARVGRARRVAPGRLLQARQVHDRLGDPDPAAREGVGLGGGEAILRDRDVDEGAALEGVDGGDQREDQDEHDREHDAPFAARIHRRARPRTGRKRRAHGTQLSGARAAIAG